MHIKNEYCLRKRVELYHPGTFKGNILNKQFWQSRLMVLIIDFTQHNFKFCFSNILGFFVTIDIVFLKNDTIYK